MRDRDLTPVRGGGKAMLLSIRRDAHAPICRQLRSQLEYLIRHGGLPAGTKLPSSRALARCLGVSRNTVIDVYETLAADGIIEPLPLGVEPAYPGRMTGCSPRE